MTPSLHSLRAEGVLSALDVHFARAAARLAGEGREAVLLAAALASRQVSEGHVCLDLEQLTSGLGPAPLELREGPDVREGASHEAAGVDRTWPAAARWLAELRDSDLVDGSEMAGEGLAPLVLDASGRLYLRRYWEHQQRLATALRRRITQAEPPDEIDETLLAAGLERMFPAREAAEQPDLQRLTAERAMRSRFLAVTGGPGTGKTSAVVKILVLLAEQALARGEPAPRMTLTAPTGKAAARLQESVARSLQGLECADAVRTAIPEVATTIHRCLGPLARPSARFETKASSQLETDLMVVDEASMVDLALMSRLVEATPARARLILLGDRDQLASVEAGSVLGDIATVHGGASEATARRAERSLIELVHSHRFGAASGIGALCRAINAGEADTALALLDDPAHADVTLHEPSSDGALPADWTTEVRAGYAPLFATHDGTERLRALEGFRVLCAHRRGAAGVDALNRAILRLWVEAGALRAGGELQDGMPVGVTRNDYELGLYNGDVGLVVDTPDADGLRVLFPDPGGAPRFVSPLRLRHFETVFAMTIHKSQGSEFDAVSVMLPDELSPVLTRELVYTAVSRARERVRLYAHRDVLREAIGRRVARSSGLREALWAADAMVGSEVRVRDQLSLLEPS